MASEAELREIAQLRADAELLWLEQRDDVEVWRASWRARERWFDRWERECVRWFRRMQREQDLEELIWLGQRAWRRIGKASLPPTDDVAIAIALRAPSGEFVDGAMAAYVELALNTGEDAGQFTLDALGLNRTFAWASIRDFVGHQLAVRGSKILQAIYGNHKQRLARMVVEKCNPAAPKTVGQLTKEIREEWSALSRKEAARIARTEAAHVWEQTNWNAMTLNGVQRVDWVIASGPSIGVRVGPVCRHCLAMASRSPYVMEDMEELPPKHPHCRCTLIPVLDVDWLPPAEPWTGAEYPLRTFT